MDGCGFGAAVRCCSSMGNGNEIVQNAGAGQRAKRRGFRRHASDGARPSWAKR
ncbi:hypothetical protein HMPREF0762_01471 [Slackia exigua ATCC 700122]|uniref:Uncharacterized protein n=1 Tax=Slackia exigua (strain ATCC 700122 / DSM 15923 / CIP 105133 / JCM 11022 / KCTC 5966 / S-7) TaxID=649764 RepID=D0WHZ9_SLAES|nr:hypothetical protein HMPREF0762_01471 [Slackia exigua ATCC 700122]